ncbi:MAG: glycosyltransferase [Rubrivivax sp.]
MFDRSDGAGSARGPEPLADRPPVAGRVSVLVRSMGRDSLADALASVAAQTLAPFEVVIVNASGRPHPPLPAVAAALPCRVVEPGMPLRRAAAANRALHEARGDWLLFLDDDDRLGPAHLQRLLQALQDGPGHRVAHAGVTMVDAEGRERGVLDEPVDRVSLWSANRLAIHAVMFARSLVDEGMHFDDRFEVYEDWDFWFQLARRERFVHVPGASAEYRLVGSSGASEPHDAERSRTLRRPFYAKWLGLLDADELEALAASAEHARAHHQEALQLLHAAKQQAQRHEDARQRELLLLQARHDRTRTELLKAQARLDETAAALERERQTLAETRLEARREAEARQEAHTAELQRAEREQTLLVQQLQQAHESYARLESGYRAVTGSLSWRVTAPLRELRGLGDGAKRAAWARRLWRALPLSNDQRLRIRDAVLARGPGRRAATAVLPDLASRAEAAAPAPPAAPTDKERVRAEAEAALGAFLQGSDRIDLAPRSATPEVSVIVVLFNQAGLSRLCLQALAASEGVSVQTLIVDNGSSDRVPELLTRVDGATVLRPGENLGFLRAVNLAAGQATGRHLVLLNNDAMVEPHTLRAAVERLQRDAGAGAVGGPILLWNGRLQEAGSIVWNDGSCLGYGRDDDPARPEYGFVRDVDYCSGAFLMIRRELFERLGRLDTAFVPAYYEESDFCVRLWEAGHRIVYDPRVRIRHFEFASEVASGWAIELQRQHRELFVQRHPAFLAAQCAPSTAALLRARMRLAPGAKRVLMIDDRVPLPWLGQGYPRAAHLVATLAQMGHAVTHYPLQFPNESEADVRRALPETVEVMLGHGHAALPAFLQARRGLYDVVIVSRPHNMQALRRLLDDDPQLLQGARLAYDAEAMFSLRDIARAALDGRPLPAHEQRERIGAELALAEGADAVIAVSEAEAAHYRAAGFSGVQVLGHEVDVVHETPGFEPRRDLLFVGALMADDTPNADSLRWFVGEVWPQVVAALGPEVRLHVVGPCEAPSVRALAGPQVRLHGLAAELAPHLDGARLFVVPTRYAAGIPHKAHEAAARGLPMVTTPLIAQQLGWQGFLPEAPDAPAFARACIELCRDPAAWDRQRRAVLQAVQRDCSAGSFRSAVARLLDGAVAPPSDAAPAPVDEAPVHEPPLAPAADAAGPADEGERRTAELWGRDAAQRDDQARQRRHWSAHPVTVAEINQAISGDGAVGWLQHLKRTRFPATRARGLSLGCGSGAVVVDALVSGLVERMDGVDLSAAAIEVARDRARRAGVAGRAGLRVVNANEMAIDGPLDLIVFEQSLHHVDALGPVLDRCAAALADDGFLVINEYVGPDRFQWSDEAERLMNAILERLPAGHRLHPDSGEPKLRMQRVDPQQVIALDPSEAIHSGDILPALAQRFELVESRPFGGTLLQFLLADIAANFDPEDSRDVALLRLMSLLEAELVRCGAIGSDFVYAVYRRRAAA